MLTKRSHEGVHHHWCRSSCDFFVCFHFSVGGVIMIYVNGNLVTDADSLTLHDYLSREGYSFAFIAVECNGQIIPKSI